MRGRVVGVAVAVVGVVAAVAVVDSAPDRPPPAVPPPVYIYGRVPDAVDIPQLPSLPTTLPADLAMAATAAPLSAAPVERAVALFVVGKAMHVLGEDGFYRTFDLVPLQPASDTQGNQHPAVQNTSLSPDGRYAAFPQRDKVVVVGFGGASVAEIAVAGHNEWVTWLGTTLVVSGTGATWLVDPVGGAVTRAPFDGSHAVYDRSASPDVFELSQSNTLKRWVGSEAKSIVLPESPTEEWLPPAHRSGDRIVALGHKRNLAREQELHVLAVDGSAATASHALFVGELPVQLLGWLDGDTVLIRVLGGSGGWIVAWHLPNDAVTRVARVSGEVGVASVSGLVQPVRQ